MGPYSRCICVHVCRHLSTLKRKDRWAKKLISLQWGDGPTNSLDEHVVSLLLGLFFCSSVRIGNMEYRVNAFLLLKKPWTNTLFFWRWWLHLTIKCYVWENCIGSLLLILNCVLMNSYEICLEMFIIVLTSINIPTTSKNYEVSLSYVNFEIRWPISSASEEGTGFNCQLAQNEIHKEWYQFHLHNPHLHL